MWPEIVNKLLTKLSLYASRDNGEKVVSFISNSLLSVKDALGDMEIMKKDLFGFETKLNAAHEDFNILFASVKNCDTIETCKQIRKHITSSLADPWPDQNTICSGKTSACCSSVILIPFLLLSSVLVAVIFLVLTIVAVAYRENEKSSTPLKSCGNLETQLSFPTTTTTPEQTTQSKPSSSSNPDIEDILICGRCRKLFDTVDELLSHKTMNYCVIGVNDRDSEHSCRCKALGEPESLGCYFCNKKFLSSWELLEHYRLEHNLTAYRVPKPPKPSSSSTSKQEMSVSEPIFTSNNSRVKEKPLDSQKSLEKESKCQDELDDSVEIVESPESSNNTICILSDDENDDTE
ncbi:unnamed protein product [Rodentolepis nana]|uniref:C2H2-type domain-containing protein n=1 Tax=Rodentolepis nana TaxID=102285 RepID=A0A0R3TQU8_RODNA|nr:unnamed protein product [Rodentolepis nana]